VGGLYSETVLFAGVTSHGLPSTLSWRSCEALNRRFRRTADGRVSIQRRDCWERDDTYALRYDFGTAYNLVVQRRWQSAPDDLAAILKHIAAQLVVGKLTFANIGEEWAPTDAVRVDLPHAQHLFSAYSDNVAVSVFLLVVLFRRKRRIISVSWDRRSAAAGPPYWFVCSSKLTPIQITALDACMRRHTQRRQDGNHAFILVRVKIGRMDRESSACEFHRPHQVRNLLFGLAI